MFSLNVLHTFWPFEMDGFQWPCEVILFMHLPGTDVLRVLGHLWRHCASNQQPIVHLRVPGFYQLWSLPLDLEFDCPWVTVTF